MLRIKNTILVNKQQLIWHLQIIVLSWIKARGSKLILSDIQRWLAQRRKSWMLSRRRYLQLYGGIFWIFQKTWKVDILFYKFLHKKVSIKKWRTLWQSQRKILQNSHLRFLIFETLSQRFLTTKFSKTQTVKKIVIQQNKRNLWPHSK